MVEVEGSNPFPPTRPDHGEGRPLLSPFLFIPAAVGPQQEPFVEQPQITHAQMIRSQLEMLLKLQVLDQEISALQARVHGHEVEIRRQEGDLEKGRQTVADRKHALEQMLKERREAERTVKERQEQIAKLGGQLYEVKNNEAYNTLQHEIKQKKQENALLEERILEMMLAEDEANADIARESAAGQQAVGRTQETTQEHRQEIARLGTEISALRTRWEDAAREVPADLLDRYLKLRDNKAGTALAKIENGICTGCRLSIRPQAVIELKKSRALLVCDNCARILYVD